MKVLKAESTVSVYFLQQLMDKRCLFFLLLCLTVVSQISADLTLIEYDPLIFQLTFSEPVEPSSFQLLYNNLYNVSYDFETKSDFRSVFRMRADTSAIEKTTSLESYNLLFNNPLNVGNGKLDIASYAITAKKSNILINFPTALGIVLVLVGYILNSFTEIGKLIIQFMQIYVLFMFQSRMTTSINKQIYTGLLLIPPPNILLEQIGDYEAFIICCLTIPMVVMLFFVGVGFIYKRVAVGQKSILGNIVYDQLVYSSFLKSTRVFLFNLLYNSIMFLKIAKDPTLAIDMIDVDVGYMLVYFNITACIAIVYLKFFILNPNIFKNKESKEKYLQGKEFKHFKLLHQRVHLTPWYKRNYDIFQSLKMFLLIGMFFTNNIFQYFALLLQFMHIFFMFTVRPLVEELYLNCKVICRLLMFTQFLLIVLGNLYFSIGQVTFNYYSASKYIVARDSLFLIFQLVIIAMIFTQIYFKCTNLNYQIKLVKEANAYKLQLVQKNRQEVESKDRKHTATAFSEKFSKSSDKRMHSFSQNSSPVRRSNLTPVNMISKGSIAEKELRMKSKSKIELQMVEMTEIGREIEKQIRRDRTGSMNKSQHEKSKKKQKWKQESLLQGIVKTK